MKQGDKFAVPRAAAIETPVSMSMIGPDWPSFRHSPGIPTDPQRRATAKGQLSLKIAVRRLLLDSKTELDPKLRVQVGRIASV